METDAELKLWNSIRNDQYSYAKSKFLILFRENKRLKLRIKALKAERTLNNIKSSGIGENIKDVLLD